MLFFTSGRAPTLRRSRHNPGSWLDRAQSVDPESAMKDAGAAIRHAGGDLADAARQVSTEATRQLLANTASVRADAARQIRSGASAVRANAAAMPEELLAASPDAIRKSVEKLIPGRKKRSRRGPLLGLVAVLGITGIALLGVQMLMTRRTNRSMRREGWGRSPEDPMTDVTGIVAIAEVPLDEEPQPATFDRDAGIRAATEGMEPQEPQGLGSLASPLAEGA